MESSCAGGDCVEGIVSLVLTLQSDVEALIKALQVLQELGIYLRHIESRVSEAPEPGHTSQSESEAHLTGTRLDYFLEVVFPGESGVLQALRKQLSGVCLSVSVLPQPQPRTLNLEPQVPWFPHSIRELGRCCTALLNYGAELSPDHPVRAGAVLETRGKTESVGFSDETYKERRREIAEVAINYKHGMPIPRIEYTALEIKTWGEVFRNQTALYPSNACKEYNTHYPQLFAQAGYREDSIPQLEDVSRYLRDHTGWQLWPVLGWISSRDFLATLAFRVFPTSQYIRHHSSPFYTPEPDICHELLGHAPLFLDENFAQFSQEIGLASLGASDEWVEKLSTLYWFTVEFGMVKEGGKHKAYGAGLLSGGEELRYCVTDKPECHDFDISTAMSQTYPETGLQPLYFVADSLRDMREKMTEFAKTIARPFSLHYNPYTQSIKVVLPSA